MSVHYTVNKKLVIFGSTLFTIIAATIIGWHYGAPWIVRNKIMEAAAERGLEVHIDKINVRSFRTVWLDTVHVSNHTFNAKIDSTTIHLNWLTPTEITTNGGHVLLEQVPKRHGDGPHRTGPKISVYNVSIETKLCGGGKAEGVSVEVNGGITVVAATIEGACWGISGTAQNIKYQDGEFTAQHARVQKESLVASADDLHLHKTDEWITIRARNAEITHDLLESPISISGGHIEVRNSQVQYDFQAAADSISGGYGAISKDKLTANTLLVSGTIIEASDSLNFYNVKISRGAASVKMDFSQGAPNNWRFWAEVPEVSCQELAASIPDGVVGNLNDFQWVGSVSASVHIQLKDKQPTVHFDMHNRCRVRQPAPSMDVALFRKAFTRTVLDKDGKDMQIQSGPGSKNWVSIEAISPYMSKAVINTEDPGFMHHRGFIMQAFENAAIADMEAGKFYMGGSTVSMQLAKNLWLSRTKTLARKLQEFFLTTYLEQSLSKKQIMELYLNVVELGPSIYGIKSAAKYYFNKMPHELTLAECVFLASILPAPKRPHFQKDHTLHPGWAEHVRRLIRLARTRDLVTDTEVEIAVAENIKQGYSPDDITHITVVEGGINPSTW